MSDEMRIARLPFYWRLSPQSEKVANITKDYFPFVFGHDDRNGLVIQQRDEQVLSALDRVYTEEYNIGYLQDGNEIAKPYGKDFIEFMDYVLAQNPNIKKVLEIGCGGCVVLDSLKSDGYEVCGIDSSPFAADEGAKKGITVITDFFPSSQIRENFDMIFHVDVLEHINDYHDFLCHQHARLNDGGVVVVNVPDATESIDLGDISMAMHQHLNYFTETTLTAVLTNAGFEVVLLQKAGYGGSLYAMGRKQKNRSRDVQVCPTHDSHSFSYRADHSVRSVANHFNEVLSSDKRTLGFYVPLRALPYIASQEIYDGFRFFDDTPHWYGNVFDGVSVPIENFSDLKDNPVTDLVIMSLTFGDVIRDKVLKNFGEFINVVTLRDLIDGSNNDE